MKKIVSMLLSVILIITSSVAIGAADFDYKDSGLFEKYSTFEIISIYPDFSKYLADELRKCNTDIDVRGYNISVNDIGAVFFSVVFENPDIFYVKSSGFETTSESESGILVSIRPVYLFDTSEIPEKKEQVENAADYIIKSVDASWSDIYKCRYLHDMVCQYVEYDMDEHNNNPNLRTTYGALIDNKAVCDGYTMAYNYLLSKVGIEAHYVQSLKMLHAWSLVRIGGSYYHIDTTYDDPSYDTLGSLRHDYCIVSDTGLKADGVHHDWICGLKASDKSLDSVWWRGIRTIIFTVDGYDYYMNQRYGSSVYGAFMKRNIATGGEHVIERITSRWFVDEKKEAFWEQAFCYLAFDGNYFYYNDSEGVYRHKPNSSSNFDVLYKKPESLKNNIFGIAMKLDNNLYISIKDNPNVADEIYYIDRNVLNQNTDITPKPPVTEYVEVEGGIKIYSFNENIENIIIPEQIDGKKVVELSANLFCDRQELKTVIIPEGVEVIGDYVFYNCPNLKTVILPESLKEIGQAVFNGCTALEEITIPENVSKIGKNVFAGCVNLTIKGYKNSAAETYAAYYKIGFEALDKTPEATEPETQAPTEAPAAKLAKQRFSQKSSMYVKQRAQLSIKGADVKYSSSKTSVAAVSKKGLITAKKKGKAVITVENSKYIFKISLTVKNPKLNKTKKTLKKGKSFKLKIKGKVGLAKFKSSNKKVASVSSSGKIKAKRKGKATITVTTNGKIKLKCKIKVK